MIELARATWPDALTIEGGRLQFDGCDLAALAKERGTPLWVVSRSTVESNFEHLLEVFRKRYPRCEIAYSIKANNTMAVIALLHRKGALLDCSAEYECQIGMLAGVPPSDIILNGNGKSDVALDSAARLGMRQVNIDSLDEVRRLDQIAARLGVRVPCLVRVQLTYDHLLAEDPSFETTLRVGEGKFGSSLKSGQAFSTIEAAIESRNLDFLGLSHHVGFSGYMGDYSPEREVMHHRVCTEEVCALANEVRSRFGVDVSRLDLGGGFRSGSSVLLSTPGAARDLAYRPLPKAEDYAEAIFGTIERRLEVADLPLVQFETGGYQIANAVILLTTVSEVKDVATDPARRYVTIDASMMMFVSRGMMRVGHPVVPLVDPLRPADHVAVEVVGQTCVYDSVAEDIRLPLIERGEVLALLHQGAYCETESTQFNAFPRPEVVLVSDGNPTIVKRRETLADIHGRDLVPTDL